MLCIHFCFVIIGKVVRFATRMASAFGPVYMSYEESDISILHGIVYSCSSVVVVGKWRHCLIRTALFLSLSNLEQKCSPHPTNPLRPWPTSGTGDSCGCSGAFCRCSPKGMRKGRVKSVPEISLEHTRRTMACKMGDMIDFLARRSPRSYPGTMPMSSKSIMSPTQMRKRLVVICCAFMCTVSLCVMSWPFFLPSFLKPGGFTMARCNLMRDPEMEISPRRSSWGRVRSLHWHRSVWQISSQAATLRPMTTKTCSRAWDFRRWFLHFHL